MTAAPTIASGATLGGRYVLGEPVSEELLGTVYAAIDTQERRSVHLKALHPHLLDNEEKFARFGREITATWLVAHPSTVEVLDWGEDQGQKYLVLEQVDASPLGARIGSVTIVEAMRVAAHVASALGAAHQEGIVHRALSPDNILVVEGVEPIAIKVRDFGMSKLELSGVDEASYLTTQNTRVGHTAYMAPEYIEGGEFSTKGDLYSLGGILFHLLTGNTPFPGTMAEMLQGHVDASVPSARAVNSEVPEWLDELVSELLAKEPAERPSAYKVVQRLEAGSGLALEGQAQPSDAADIQPEDRLSRSLLAASVFAMVATGVIGVGFLAIAVLAVGAWMLSS